LLSQQFETRKQNKRTAVKALEVLLFYSEKWTSISIFTLVVKRAEVMMIGP
jgi:hypothetical protein